MKYKLIKFKKTGIIYYTIITKRKNDHDNHLYSLVPERTIDGIINKFKKSGFEFHYFNFHNKDLLEEMFEFNTKKELREEYPEYLI
jgi:hypothetical protein